MRGESTAVQGVIPLTLPSPPRSGGEGRVRGRGGGMQKRHPFLKAP